MKSIETVTLAQLRRYVVACQGYAARDRRGRPGEVEAAVRRLSAVQLDSISTVERSHRITLGSRVGAYPRGLVSRLLERGRIFEFWAHEACLLPIEDYPLHRWRMERLRTSGLWGRGTIDERPELARDVLEAIRERGPLGSRHFDGAGGGGMWNWKPAKVMLETLFAAGELAVARRDGFQRLYDLPERVIPRALLDEPAADEARYRQGFALRAVRARGALTESGISEHCRFRGGVRLVRPHVDALVDAGLVRRVAVADGGPDVVVPAGAAIDGRAAAPVLLSPFDNLLWDRAFVERVFGFRHVIEVYKRAHERLYGYYVLPFLLGDRLVGRVDLKTDRAAGALVVRAVHVEPRVRGGRRFDESLERALARLAATVGADSISR